MQPSGPKPTTFWEKYKDIIIDILVLIVIGVGVFLVWYFLIRQSSSPPPPPNMPTDKVVFTDSNNNIVGQFPIGTYQPKDISSAGIDLSKPYNIFAPTGYVMVISDG